MSEPYRDAERRGNVELRVIFAEAYAAVEPFFDPRGQWGGSNHEHLAFHAIKEQFPQLSAQDVLIVVTTARRLYTSGRRVV